MSDAVTFVFPELIVGGGGERNSVSLWRIQLTGLCDRCVIAIGSCLHRETCCCCVCQDTILLQTPSLISTKVQSRMFNCSTTSFTTALAVAVTLFTTNMPALAQGHVHSEQADRGMVVSDSAIASRVGRDVIADGGNAVDAAIATAFALAVTWPEAGNIGGGGFMMIRPADGRPPVCVEYREKAPLAARADTFTRGESRFTTRVVGVPGTVRGLELAHKEYGSVPWERLVLPSHLPAV